jgi:adenylate cyclase
MIRRLRLLSGLVMLAYVTMHLANHAVGLISLRSMEDVLWYIFRIWTNRPAQLLLYSSFLVHYALALYALWQRQTLRLRGSELSQIVLGCGSISCARPITASCRCWSWSSPGVTR